MSESTPARRPITLAILLIVFGAIGLLAAFVLTLEKFHSLQFPGEGASCDFNVLVQCTENLKSAAGSAFGFPNPVIGLMAWPVVITIGVALLARARFAAWFWIGFNLGVAGALAFVIFLISQSIYVLGTLCPWCLATWAVVIPLFWVVTLDNLRTGRIRTSPAVQRFASAAYGWIPIITLACYLVIVLIAQIELNALQRLFV